MTNSLHNSEVALAVLNPDRKIIWANAMAWTLVDHHSIGKTCPCDSMASLVHPQCLDFDTPCPLAQRDNAVLHHTLPACFQLPHTRETKFEVTCIKNPSNGQGADQILKIMRRCPAKNETELSLAIHNRELRDRIQSLESALTFAQFQASQARASLRFHEDYLANAARELCIPLRSILGFCDSLNNQVCQSDSGPELLQAIAVNSQFLLDMVTDTLSLAKFNAGRITLKNQVFSLRHMVNDLDMMFAARARNKKLAYKTLIHEDFPSTIIADPTRLRQAIANLVGNALKFTDTGGVILSISRQPESSRTAKLTIEVEDTGPGLSPRVQEKLCPAHQVEDYFKTCSFKENGIGLRITRQIASLMHGRLEVNSELGEGSTFTFTAQVGISSEQ